MLKKLSLKYKKVHNSFCNLIKISKKFVVLGYIFSLGSLVASIVLLLTKNNFPEPERSDLIILSDTIIKNGQSLFLIFIVAAVIFDICFNKNKEKA